MPPLKKGKVSKLDILASTLCGMNKEDFISIATSLLSRWRNDLFFKNIVTGEKMSLL